MKNLFLLFCIFLFIFTCEENTTIYQQQDPRYFNDAFHGNIVGLVKQKDSAAKVRVNQEQPIQEVAIDEDDGSFRLENLEIGNYDLVIEAENLRTYNHSNVMVYGGGTTYLGKIDLSKVPDLVSYHYPEDKDEIVFDRRYERLTISIAFTQPMDRQSVEDAFSTDPPSEGIFYWGQYTSQPRYIYYNTYSDPGFDEKATITTYSKVTSVIYSMSQKDSYTDTSYTVNLSTAAKDTAGNHLRFPLDFTFSTVQSSQTLRGIQTRPYHGDVDVALVQTGGIQITFPRNMDQQSTESLTQLTPQMEHQFIWPEKNRMIIYTGGPLLADTTFTIRINKNAKDLDGIELGENFEFSFRTQQVMVSNTNPNNGELFVAPQQEIRLYFNTYMSKSSVENAFSITPFIPGYFSWDTGSYYNKQMIIFYPNQNFQNNTKYTVTISRKAKDLFGSGLGSPYVFSFITRPE